jgi:hypothetical protein
MLVVCTWLLVEALLGPGVGWEQRNEDRGASIWSQSVWCMMPRCNACSASTQARHSHALWEAWSGGRALLADPSPFLLADLSLLFPFSQRHSHCHSQNSLQTTRNCIYNCIGSPGIAGAVAPAFSGDPDWLWAAPPGQPITLFLFYWF